MTSQTKTRIRNVGLWSIAVVAVVTWGVPRVVEASITSVDTRYVKTVPYTAFRDSLRTSTALDSLSAERDMRDMRAALARLDTNVTAIRRCQRRPSACE